MVFWKVRFENIGFFAAIIILGIAKLLIQLLIQCTFRDDAIIPHMIELTLEPFLTFSLLPVR